MNAKEFKNLFSEVAKLNGFSKAFGSWFKKSDECIAVLELQKSNFGDYYQLNIKIFIQGVFQRNYLPDKNLMKSSIGHITVNETNKYKSILDFDDPMDDIQRTQKLEELFLNYIVPFTNLTLSISGIKELFEKGNLFLLPAIKESLYK